MIETRAPGRVNLIGEHTDYNEGFVLPCAIARGTRVVVKEREDRTVLADSPFGSARFDLNALPRERLGDWRDYVRGVLLELESAGVHLRGAELRIRGDVPVGAGLSSSASLEIAVALALLHGSGVSMDGMELAALAQRAENEHVGTRSGMMDQIAVLFGQERCALFIDTRSLQFRTIRVPENVRIAICNTMVSRELARGEYNRRRRECEEALAALRVRYPGIAALRDVTPDELDAAADGLAPVLFRRARHVVTENARVLAAVDALQQRDAVRFGELMNASHESLRDDYEVTCEELDEMAALARAHPGVYGARMTGGGFGGCTVNLVDAAQIGEFERYIKEAYRRKTGIAAEIYDGTPAGGAEVVHD